LPQFRVDAEAGVLTTETENDMPCRLPPALALRLADGTQWTIRGGDELSSVVVSALGRAMRLKPGSSGRELLAVLNPQRFHVPQVASPAGTVVCWLAPLPSLEMQVIQMDRVASLIASASLPRGGLLLHAALAECRGVGFLMAGPSRIGKSTASRRLPLPHRSLCDDLTFVVRDDAGRYWAHPWPTWSRLLNGAPDASWPVETAVPLRGVFFLRKSATTDRVEPMGQTQATALVMESAVDLTRTIASMAEAGGSAGLWKSHLAAARALATAAQAYSLQVSLDGRFWSEIEKVLPEAGEPGLRRPAPPNGQASPGSFRAGARDSGVSRPDAGGGTLRTVCLGRAMSPTLNELEILEAEPYGSCPVRPGDVVWFKSPEKETMAQTSCGLRVTSSECKQGVPVPTSPFPLSPSPLGGSIPASRMVVRRVVSVGPRSRVVGPRSPVSGHPIGGIRTRGDNNAADDPWILQPGDIIGRVTAAQRGSRRRPIGGGFLGQVEAVLAHVTRPVRTVFARLTRPSGNPTTAPLAFLTMVLPRRLRPRPVEFNGRCWVVLKLLFRAREIGRYDWHRKIWRIRRPFRWFVDVRELPTPVR
jgi:SynChlorMet cassette protein ScmC